MRTPYQASPLAVVNTMLTLAKVGPGDVVYDLGCGDGRIVIEAAKRGAVAIGIDTDPIRVAASIRNGADARQADFHTADFSDATVVCLYLHEDEQLRLLPRLLALRPGTRIVSHGVKFAAWTPTAQTNNVYVYTVQAPYCHANYDPLCPICKRYYGGEAAFRLKIAEATRVLASKPIGRKRKPDKRERQIRQPQRINLPCIHEGATLEFCHTCKGERGHVRDCDLHERCTRGDRKKSVQCCLDCKDYEADAPAMTVNMGAGGIGDGLLGLLAVGGLKARWPDRQITYRVAPQARDFVQLFSGGYDLLGHNDWDKGGGLALRTGDLQANAGYLDEQAVVPYRRQRVERYLANIGACDPVLPTLREPERLRELGKQYAGCVFLVTQSSEKRRAIPFSVGRAIQSSLESKGLRVVAINDHWAAEELAGAFLNAACVIGCDTGLTHLAAIMGVPTVVLGGHMPVASIFGCYPSARCAQAKDMSGIDPAQVASHVDHIVLPIATGGRSIVSLDRLRVIRDCVLDTNHLAGDTAELGVYQGGVSKMILHYSQTGTHHLFDTFTGIPSDDIAEGGHHKAGDFATNVEDVRAFIDSPRATFHVGEFPGTIPAVEIRYRFVHLDGDTYQTTRDAIEYFVPRMVPGGVIVFDDYGWQHCPGVKRAIGEAGLTAEVRAANQCVWTDGIN